jgi:ArsR family transcriptional regulator, arsenate/arsenite/antimonite-responsive transcriptional repressor
MAIHKKEAFEASDRALADMAKALAHPARVAILKELARRNTCVCGEIVEVLPLAQSTVSQHLKELQQAGLIDGTVDGVKSCYCINYEALRRFEQMMQHFFSNTSNCC